MKIAVPAERREHEKRAAASPETVKKFVGLGAEVVIESGLGHGARIADAQFAEQGARIAEGFAATVEGADVVLKVQRPMRAGDPADELGQLAPGQNLVSLINPLANREDVAAYAEAGLTAFAMELMPRITRAQSMDVLSSQSNLVGYKAVLDALEYFDKAMPMMMTAAGTIAPARVLVMGAGVAGLQAIATAKRLGAVVSATDVRPAAKEQVESLGGKFLMVESEETRDAETAGGYAREMSDDYKRRQAALIAESVSKQDIIVCTALIPGRPAPTLIDDDMLSRMRPGSIVVDIAAEAGGNCTQTRLGEIVEHNGVTIIGHHNWPSRIAVDASALYARNLFNFMSPHIDQESGGLHWDWEDETVTGVCVTRDGAITHPLLTGEGG